MSKDAYQRRPLSYAAPTAGGAKRPWAWIALIMVNTVAGVGSLRFVELATHIWSCEASSKECYLQAVLLGGPAVGVIIVLGYITALCSIVSRRTQGRRWILLGAWLPLMVAAVILICLCAAVIHNWW